MENYEVSRRVRYGLGAYLIIGLLGNTLVRAAHLPWRAAADVVNGVALGVFGYHLLRPVGAVVVESIISRRINLDPLRSVSRGVLFAYAMFALLALAQINGPALIGLNVNPVVAVVCGILPVGVALVFLRAALVSMTPIARKKGSGYGR